jgi:guanylate kinase
MGNAASVKPELFSAMKMEYEGKKDQMTDDELFLHMKKFHDNLVEAAKPTVTALPSKDIVPIVVAGPSGAGKGTIIANIMKKFPKQFGFSVSHTTRAARPGEDDGIHYHFTTMEAMDAGIAKGEFVEFAEVHGNKYGTSSLAVLKVKSGGKIPILDIDIQGVRKVKASSMAAKFIFIQPPSMEELEKRLRGRGTEEEEKILVRMANAKGEMDFGTPENFDAIVVNDDIEKCSDAVLELIKQWNPLVSFE